MFFHRMSIKELVDSKWSEDLKEYVVTVRGEIFEIDNQFGWYYVACKSCGKKVEAEDGDYKCCNKIIDYPLVMFKVHVHIKDHTGTTTLTLFNNIVERLLDTSAKKLVNKLTSGDSDLPKELNTLIGKEFIYRLRLNHYNFKQGYANYTVSEIYEPRKCLEHEYESKKALEIRANVKDKLTCNDGMEPPRECGKRKASMIDDAEESGGNKVEGEVKPTVEVRKRRKMVVLDDDDDDDDAANDNGDAN
ncbi:replication factor A protein 1-like [Daucus carota subsp. sativus]|uniref:replication factor A protein 1-like n=1 Tax=Daucus carota subsp. sativus TaxID=79200 RepID=UPI003082C63A